jgi:hypothetical protein
MTDYVGALKDLSAIELGAVAARGAFERSGVKPEWIDVSRFRLRRFRSPVTHSKFPIPNS